MAAPSDPLGTAPRPGATVGPAGADTEPGCGARSAAEAGSLGGAAELVLPDLLDTVFAEGLFGLPDRAEITAVDADPGEYDCRVPVDGGWLSLRLSSAVGGWRFAGGPVRVVSAGTVPRTRPSQSQRSATLPPTEVLRLLIGPGEPPPGAAEVLADLGTAVEHAAVLAAQRDAVDLRPTAKTPIAGERLVATRGRPFHPTARAVSGWTAAELERYGPLRLRPLALAWVAVRRDHLRQGPDPAARSLERDLLSAEDACRLADALREQGISGAEYQPLPVHPWHAERILRPGWAAEIRSRDVLPLSPRLGAFRPTASIRTLATADPARHVKLPLGVRTLGATRLLPPRYLDNADRAARTMAAVLAADTALGRRVVVAAEGAWAGWRSVDADDEFDDRPGELAAQLRRYPAEVFTDGRVVLPMAALAAPDWGLLAPLFGLPGEPSGPGLAERVLAVFGRIAGEFCAVALGFLRHGVLPEVHGQNVLLAVRDGRPERFVLRDHDTLRICPEWLAAAGTPDPEYRIRPGARQSLRLDSPSALVGYLQTLGLQVNLGGIAHAMSCWSTVDESRFWLRLRRELEGVLAGSPLSSEVTELAEAVLLRAPSWPTRTVLGPLLAHGASAGVSMPAGTGSRPNPLWPANLRPIAAEVAR